MLQNRAASLSHLPNIGATLAVRLAAAGVITPGDLDELGSIGAALRMRAASPQDPPCQSTLYALEGALRGIRWHAISREDRDKLWQEYQARCGYGGSFGQGSQRAETAKD